MKLIDGDKLIENAFKNPISYTAFCNLVKRQPPVDAVPVVRCKDCKHRDPEDKKCDCGHDIRWQLPRDDYWYCADGEQV